MRFVITLCCLIFNFFVFSQSKYLIIQRNDNVCLDSLASFNVKDTLPTTLSQFNAIFLFSNARSLLSTEDINRIITYLNNGGGLYTGADNWPLQAESNQVTEKLFNKESFGNYHEDIAEASADGGNLKLKELNQIPAGKTTAAFPMDYRLKVEAWISDQPLILSGNIQKGRIIIDGGYSRFYCERWDTNSAAILEKFLQFLD